MFSGEAGASVAVRLYTWIAGSTMSATGSSASLLYREGIAVGKMSMALTGFSHPGLERTQFWDGKHFSAHIRPFSALIEEPALRRRVEQVLDAFEKNVLPASSAFPPACIMGDCNDANLIVTAANTHGERDIAGS